jgi:hypothetical protein
MKQVFYIISTLSVLAACSGGGGGGETTLKAVPDTRYVYNTENLVLDGDRFQIAVDSTMYDLPSPKWVDDVAAGQDAQAQYLAARDLGYVVVAGHIDGQPFTQAEGAFGPVYGSDDIYYSGHVTLVSGQSKLSSQIDLTLQLGWSVPRLLGNVPAHQLDVSAIMDKTGAFSGEVGYNGAKADLSGGFFTNDPTKEGAMLGAAFAGQTFYGVIAADRID